MAQQPDIDVRQLVAYDFCPHFSRHYTKAPVTKPPALEDAMNSFLREYLADWIDTGRPMKQDSAFALWGDHFARAAKEGSLRNTARRRNQSLACVHKVLDWFDLHDLMPMGIDVTLSTPLFMEGQVLPGSVKVGLPFHLYSRRRKISVFLQVETPTDEPHEIFLQSVVRGSLSMYSGSMAAIDCYSLSLDFVQGPTFESFTTTLSADDGKRLHDLHTKYHSKNGSRSILACAFCPIKKTCKKKGL